MLIRFRAACGPFSPPSSRVSAIPRIDRSRGSRRTVSCAHPPGSPACRQPAGHTTRFEASEIRQGTSTKCTVDGFPTRYRIIWHAPGAV